METRITTKELLSEKYIEPIKVGDKGFVRFVDCMGDDTSIVNAARVSYGNGTKRTSSDTNLIRYLIRHNHSSPVEMCEIVFHIKAPIHVLRQLVRHRTASLNEVSTRYSVVKDEFEEFTELRSQSQNNKQGSGEILIDEEALIRANSSIRESYESYNQMIVCGIAREQARNVLPLATYSEIYWKIDARNLLHFLHLRLDEHAQLEIRQFAEAIAMVVKDWIPVTYEAWEDYVKNAVTFSRQEMNHINLLISQLDADGLHRFYEALVNDSSLSKREKEEFGEKLRL